MFGRAILQQTQQVQVPLVIKNGQGVSYPLNVALLEGSGGRGLQWIYVESSAWDAADLVPYLSDDAYVDPTSADEALKRGDFKEVAKSNAANWFPLEDKSGTTIRIASIPTGSGNVKHVRALHPEFWVIGTWKYLRFVSTNTASLVTVNQTADRTFWVKPLY